MFSSQRIPVTDESSVGSARRAVNDICDRLGGDETFCGRASILTTEMARNLVRHAGGGLMIVRQLPSPHRRGIDLLAIDSGPGMRSVVECMRDGYSTIGTAGTGLGAIQRLASAFDVFSKVGQGTVVWARLPSSSSEQQQGPFEIGGVSVPMGGEDECGDAWDIIQEPGKLRIMVADGLGHGAFAAEAAREAISVFRAHAKAPIAEVLENTHSALMKTRGAAASIVEIREATEQAFSAGVGNVSMRIVHGSGSKTFISDNGTLGARIRKVQEAVQPCARGSLLVLHSDGLGAQWNLEDYPGLAMKHPGLIAGVLYRDFKRDRDDVTVIVVRFKA